MLLRFVCVFLRLSVQILGEQADSYGGGGGPAEIPEADPPGRGPASLLLKSPRGAGLSVLGGRCTAFVSEKRRPNAKSGSFFNGLSC